MSPATGLPRVGPALGKWASESCLNRSQFLLSPRPGLPPCLTSDSVMGVGRGGEVGWRGRAPAREGPPFPPSRGVERGSAVSPF